MPSSTRVNISPWVFWLCAALSVIPLLYSIPATYGDIQSERAIRQYGGIANGIVLSHEQISNGGRGCKSRLKVAYEVASTPYELAEIVCGTSPAQLPKGRAIDVRYNPTAPHSAILRSPSLETSKGDWSALLVELAIPFVLAWMGFEVRRRNRLNT